MAQARPTTGGRPGAGPPPPSGRRAPVAVPNAEAQGSSRAAMTAPVFTFHTMTRPSSSPLARRSWAAARGSRGPPPGCLQQRAGHKRWSGERQQLALDAGCSAGGALYASSGPCRGVAGTSTAASRLLGNAHMPHRLCTTQPPQQPTTPAPTPPPGGARPPAWWQPPCAAPAAMTSKWWETSGVGRRASHTGAAASELAG